MRKARDVVFCPGMSSHIKEGITLVLSLQSQLRENPKGPLHEEVENSTWPLDSSSCRYVCSFRRECIVLVDYYSDLIEAKELADTTSLTIVQLGLKK